MTTFMRRLLRDGMREFRGMPDPSEGRYGFTPWGRKFPLAPVADFAELFRSPETFTIHAIVRHPHGRILSAWRDKFRNPWERSSGVADDTIYPPSIRHAEIGRIRRFALRRGLAGSTPGTLVPFDTFVAYVAATPEGRRNHHWDLQTKCLQSHLLPIHRLIRMERDLRTALPEALARVGFDPDWVLARLATPVRSSGSPSGDEWTPDSFATVSRVYAQDFAAFGYVPADLAVSRVVV